MLYLMRSAGMLAALALSTASRSRGLAPMSAAALARRDGDLADDARPDLAALFVLAALAVLDVGPFGMSGHGGVRLSWETLDSTVPQVRARLRR